jgi:dihydroflavonol-4-reductase
MRALVTGSTGLLGNNLVRMLLQAGHEVWALARSKEKVRRELGDTTARIIVGDVRNVAEFAYDLRGTDVARNGRRQDDLHELSRHRRTAVRRFPRR